MKHLSIFFFAMAIVAFSITPGSASTDTNETTPTMEQSSGDGAITFQFSNGECTVVQFGDANYNAINALALTSSNEAQAIASVTADPGVNQIIPTGATITKMGRCCCFDGNTCTCDIPVTTSCTAAGVCAEMDCDDYWDEGEVFECD